MTTNSSERVGDKDIFKKTEREHVDDNLVSKQYFPRAHMKERKLLETGSIAVGANSSLAADERAYRLL
jgi:hypothetical protein